MRRIPRSSLCTSAATSPSRCPRNGFTCSTYALTNSVRVLPRPAAFAMVASSTTPLAAKGTASCFAAVVIRERHRLTVVVGCRALARVCLRQPCARWCATRDEDDTPETPAKFAMSRRTSGSRIGVERWRSRHIPGVFASDDRARATHPSRISRIFPGGIRRDRTDGVDRCLCRTPCFSRGSGVGHSSCCELDEPTVPAFS